MADGTELPADLVVYATGYGSMNGWVADLISQDVADKVGKVWGLGSDTTKDPGPWEGEQRNMWKPTQQEALWFHGGNLRSRATTRCYLALQLKARVGGDRHAGLRAAGGAPPQLTVRLLLSSGRQEHRRAARPPAREASPVPRRRSPLRAPAVAARGDSPAIASGPRTMPQPVP